MVTEKVENVINTQYMKMVRGKLLQLSSRREELLDNVERLKWGKKGSLVSTTKQTAETNEDAWNNSVKLQGAVERAEKYRVVHAAKSKKSEEARSKAEQEERQYLSAAKRGWKHLQRNLAPVFAGWPREILKG